MSFISRKRKPKDVEEKSKNLQGRFAESLTLEFEKLKLKSSKRIKGRKENSKKDLLNSRQSIELPLEVKREELEKIFMTKEMVLMFQTMIIMISIHHKWT